MSKPDGGPAFPAQHSIDGNWVTKPLPEFCGMTLRDHFAAAALQGLLSDITDNVPVLDQANPLPEQLKWATYKTATAYRLADAMLAERAK